MSFLEYSDQKSKEQKSIIPEVNKKIKLDDSFSEIGFHDKDIKQNYFNRYAPILILKESDFVQNEKDSPTFLSKNNQIKAKSDKKEIIKISEVPKSAKIALKNIDEIFIWHKFHKKAIENFNKTKKMRLEQQIQRAHQKLQQMKSSYHQKKEQKMKIISRREFSDKQIRINFT